MIRKKMIISGALALVVIISVTLICILYFTNRTNKKQAANISQSGPLILNTNNEIKGLNEIVSNYDMQNYSKVLELYDSYSKDKTATDSSLLTASTLCLDAAVKISNNAAKKQCYDKSKSLALASNDPDTRTKLVENIELIYVGKIPQVISQDSHE
jgi:cbb3-type cytochrome oxidase subunit 3